MSHNILNLKKAKQLIDLYKQYKVKEKDISIYSDFDEKLHYYTFEGAKYLVDNVVNEDICQFADFLDYLQPSVARFFVERNVFITFQNIETLTNECASVLGTHLNGMLYMYNIKFLSANQALMLFKKEYNVDINDLCYT